MTACIAIVLLYDCHI